MIKINKKLYNNIVSYCKINNIKDINFFIEELIKKQFYIECYGELSINNDIEKPITQNEEIANNDIKEEPVILNNDIKNEHVVLNNDIKDEPVIEKPIIKNNVIKTRLK
jgi:hypothetical protein